MTDRSSNAVTNESNGFASKRERVWHHVRRALIIIGVVALLVYVWDEHVKYNVIAKNFGVVEEDRIYRSGKLTPRMLEHVAQEHGIRTIIDFGGYESGSDEERAIHAVDERLQMTRHQLPMLGDGTGDPNMMIAALHLMADESRHPILVHCAAGAQRTGVCILLYDVLERGIPLSEAYANAISFGHDPGRNWHFPMFVGMSIEDIARSYHEGTPMDRSIWQQYLATPNAAIIESMEPMGPMGPMEPMEPEDSAPADE